MVKEVRQKEIVVQAPDGSLRNIPYGLLVWATGNTTRPLIRTLMSRLPESQGNRRGLTVDDLLRLQGTEGVWAVGDVTATKYAPTAQVASQQGKYLARVFNQLAVREELEKQVNAMAEGPEKDKAVRKVNRLKDVKPFHYSHQGSLAYIGSEKAIADLPLFHGNISAGGVGMYRLFLLWWSASYSLFNSSPRFTTHQPHTSSGAPPISPISSRSATVPWLPWTGSRRTYSAATSAENRACSANERRADRVYIVL